MSKVTFTPAMFSLVKSSPGALTPLVLFVWVGVNTAIALRTKKISQRPFVCDKWSRADS